MEYRFRDGAKLAGLTVDQATTAALVLRFAGHAVTTDGVMDDQGVAVLAEHAQDAQEAYLAARHLGPAATCAECAYVGQHGSDGLLSLHGADTERRVARRAGRRLARAWSQVSEVATDLVAA